MPNFSVNQSYTPRIQIIKQYKCPAGKLIMNVYCRHCPKLQNLASNWSMIIRAYRSTDNSFMISLIDNNQHLDSLWIKSDKTPKIYLTMNFWFHKYYSVCWVFMTKRIRVDSYSIQVHINRASYQSKII